MEDEEVPSEYPINIVTETRVWILYAENKLSQDEWAGRFKNIMTGAYDTIAYANISVHSRNELLSDADKPPSPMIKSSSAELASMGQNKVKVNSSSRTRKSSIFYKGSSTIDSPTHVNISEQSRRIASMRVASTQSYMTGNLPMLSLSVFSQVNIDEMDYYELFKSYCSNISPSVLLDLQKRIFDHAIFDLSPKEGEILIHEGSRFEWIYFLLKGEVSRRKGWGGEGSKKVIAQSLQSGQCIGDVECLLLDNISPFTIIVGPNTTFMKIKKEIFIRECIPRTFQSKHQSMDQKKEGLFTAKFNEKDENNSFYTRYKYFCSHLISCHSLFEKQSKSNINEISKLFKPIFKKAGEILIDIETNDKPDNENKNIKDLEFDFFLLIDGTCSVFKKNILGSEQCVHSIRSGDWIGETGFFKQRKNDTKIIAAVDSILLQTNAIGFQRFLDIGGPNVRHSVERSVTNHMASLIKNIPLFHDLEEHTIENICVFMSLKEYPANTILVESGNIFSTFCIIIHGKVDGCIDKSGDLIFSSPPVVDTISENDYFGEGWILLSNHLAEATYVISSDSKVVALCASIQDFKTIVESSPHLRLRLEERFQLRKTRMEMTHSLATVIAQSLKLTMAPGSNMKLSFDTTITRDDNEALQSELVFLRAEVERLGGAKYQRPLGKKALRQIEEDKIINTTASSSSSPSPVISRRTSLKQLLSPSTRDRSKSPQRNLSPPRTVESSRSRSNTTDSQDNIRSANGKEKR